MHIRTARIVFWLFFIFLRSEIKTKSFPDEKNPEKSKRVPGFRNSKTSPIPYIFEKQNIN